MDPSVLYVMFSNRGNGCTMFVSRHCYSDMSTCQGQVGPAVSDPGSPSKPLNFGSSCCGSCVGRKACWLLSCLRWLGEPGSHGTHKPVVGIKLDQLLYVLMGKSVVWGPHSEKHV